MGVVTIDHHRGSSGEPIPADALESFGETVRGVAVKGHRQEVVRIGGFTIIDTRDRGWAVGSVVSRIKLSNHCSVGSINETGGAEQARGNDKQQEGAQDIPFGEHHE